MLIIKSSRDDGPNQPPVAGKMGNLGSVSPPDPMVLTTITTAPAIGAKIWACFCWTPNGTGDVVTFGDNKQTGGVWTTDVQIIDAGANIGLAVGHTITKATMPTGSHITASVGAPVSEACLCAFDETNPAYVPGLPLDGHSSVTGTSSTTLSPGSVTPTNVPDWGVAAYAGIVAGGNTPCTGTSPAGWTELYDFSDSTEISLQVNIMTVLTSAFTAINPQETFALGPHLHAAAAMALYKYTRKNPDGGQVVVNAVDQAATR